MPRPKRRTSSLDGTTDRREKKVDRRKREVHDVPLPVNDYAAAPQDDVAASSEDYAAVPPENHVVAEIPGGERNIGHNNHQFAARQLQPNIQPFYAGAMDVICQFCRARRFRGEKLNCCHNGKVVLNNIDPYPQELHQLLMGNNELSQNYHTNIRQYNSALAFASFGAHVSSLPGQGSYCFKIHGQIYHRSGTLYPNETNPPVFSQLYILEGDQAVEARMAQAPNQSCRRDIMHILTIALDRLNPYAAAYKHMHQLQQDNPTQTVTMFLKQGHDQRRYNEPRHDEVAAVFVGDQGAPPVNRDIVVHPRDCPAKTISYMSVNCDPMVYPLLFPTGQLGWHHTLEHRPEYRCAHRNTVTLLQFYSYRLAVREEFSALHNSRKLFQQYCVDAYIKTEASRLQYLRQNQKQLRVELYQGLMDHIHTQAAERILTPGKMVILPSSFQGSPRAMQQNYQDAMSIISKYGRPDFFLTFTCNPKCKEITENLLSGQRTEDRPDLVSRVYNRHLQELLIDIKKRHILGKPVAFVYVIEFQKRGLPHSHMLIVLHDDCKMRHSDDIDMAISAEIPDRETDPLLYNVVTTTMIHGPCGVLNPNAVCMIDGSCRKDFPKEFADRTTLEVNGYPHYMRRDNGRTVKIHNVEVDNRWVVPYNAYISRKYQAHINLEACTTIKSVKYLFKYIYKGHDCASVEMRVTNELSHDEITTYLDARYVSAPEALWRLSEHHLQESSHTIIRLPVHLPREQPVYFTEGNEEQSLERAKTMDTMLTAWFKLNQSEPNQILYTEIPMHFVFNSKHNKWYARKKGGSRIIARMYTCSPKNIEKFCLRLLLLHVSGATSFADLRTVDGHVADTFKEACQLLHLLDDDTQWNDTLAEGARCQMPSQLRTVFATICCHCSPQDPLQLWMSHKDSMTEDYVEITGLTREQAENYALNDISTILLQYGITCEMIGLPAVQPIDVALLGFDFAQEQQTATENIALLNEDQRTLFDLINEAMNDIGNGHAPKCRAFFLDGPGGSGKTMVYNTLIAHFRGNGFRVASSAWTGIAATLLTEGITLHSLFKLPVPVLDNSTCNVSPTSVHAEKLRISMFIIDEASKVPLHALHAIDRMLQDITGISVPFGGKIFLMGGDFRQVLPVIPRRSPAVIIENCIKRSPLWPSFKIVKLTKNMRANEQDQEFSKWLIQLGNQTLRSIEPSAPRGTIHIPKQCNVIQDDIVGAIFPDLSSPEELAKTAIVSSTNDNTLKLNNTIVDRLKGHSRTYFSFDAALCEDPMEALNYPTEFLNSITPSGMPPHLLKLKSGTIIMLLRNLDLSKGLCNGTRLILRRLYDHVLDAEILQGANRGQRMLIPRIKLAPSDVSLPFTLQRAQFPIRIAYCMTINKAQGQTFDKLGIYLPSPVFSHGQLYVAFSRARSFKDIYVKVEKAQGQGHFGTNYCTQNVGYPEILM